jgi:hypothetical protein
MYDVCHYIGGPVSKKKTPQISGIAGEQKPKKIMPVGRPFQKGRSGNPGGKKPLPEELKIASRLTAEEFIGLCNKFLKMNIVELMAVTGDPKNPNQKSTMLEMLVASIIRKSLNEGDPRRLDFLLNRIIGEVQKRLEVTGDLNVNQNGSPTVILQLPPTDPIDDGEKK